MFDNFKEIFDQGDEGEDDKKEIEDFSTGDQEPDSYNYQDFNEEGGDNYGGLWERFDPEAPDTEHNQDIEFVVQFNNLDDLNNYLEGTPESVLRVYAFQDDEGDYYYDVYRYDS